MGHDEQLSLVRRLADLYPSRVYYVNTYVDKYHPGSHKPIQHMVGKDATGEVVASVHVSTTILYNYTLELTVVL